MIYVNPLHVISLSHIMRTFTIVRAYMCARLCIMRAYIQCELHVVCEPYT
ncbi:Caveolin-1 [Gossypium arboreum]|uniref:Caveolin-1 n=1 Tax=Gossypium arboreum TaxID=29729 RepID=A0A0B0N881_GOSAR|nr:Caveolin-1 [Gossypium arboreum]